MQRNNGIIRYSARDLVGFLDCEHISTLDRINLDTPLSRAPDTEESQLLKEKGLKHEKQYAQLLKERHASYVDLSGTGRDIERHLALTAEAMRAGAAVIYQGALQNGDFIGYPDFLRRVERPSNLGAYSYEVVDTKLAQIARAKFIIQLAFYSGCLLEAQGRLPGHMYIVLGDQTEEAFRYSDYERYVLQLRRRFEEKMRSGAQDTYPEPCDYCDLCRWRLICAERRAKDDHLSEVAGITRLQTKKLAAAGLDTLEKLGSLHDSAEVTSIAPEVFQRIRQQARLQLEARRSGKRSYQVLGTLGEVRGLARLPRPDPGDMFFDMEGVPYEENGLEYLFGVYFFEHGIGRYKAFWGHTRAEEKRAFEAFMDFVIARLGRYPGAHLYHYAPYEPSALKRLMSLHGTRETELDILLRRNAFVDLHRVVREGIRISEPKYSLKNVEQFYKQRRKSTVKDGSASIVQYERWKDSRDDMLLKDIETYNFDDARSTYELREWLLSMRHPKLNWPDRKTKESKDVLAAGEPSLAEMRLMPYAKALIEPLPAQREQWSAEHRMREMAFYLLDFHRRQDKPGWWALFARMDMTGEELIEDPECLGGLQLVPPVFQERRTMVWRYRYPVQETKLKHEDDAVIAATGEAVSSIRIDTDKQEVRIRRAEKREPLPERISLGPARPVDSSVLREAVFRFSDALIADLQGDPANRYGAIRSFLRQDIPDIAGHAPGTPIVADDNLTVAAVADAVARLQNSYLFIQGPPGAGKTYTGSHAIIELLRRGYKVGVSSNGHKAINNLLQAVEEVAKETGFQFRGAKKSSRDDADSLLRGTLIADLFDKRELTPKNYQLIGGTAWLFSDPALDQALDFLFIDEAGQVSLANMVAMGTSARNLVLLGDQMQLGQPVRGIHPGQAGLSSLEYLLQGQATIAPDRGIFLKTTWRMHPRVCRFVSDAVYDSRLEAEPHTVNQQLRLTADAHPALKPAGISFVEVRHDACSQTSEEEARLVRQLVDNLMQQRLSDRKGVERPFVLEDVLVVAPYNMQVNLLKQVLPEGARVGTVDKFQGQQAQVVIMSMTTSSGEYLPRFVEFLFSRNRLNVALSRARSLAVVLANPDLLTVPCRTPGDMALVNTLCWIRDYAGGT